MKRSRASLTLENQNDASESNKNTGQRNENKESLIQKRYVKSAPSLVNQTAKSYKVDRKPNTTKFKYNQQSKLINVNNNISARRVAKPTSPNALVRKRHKNGPKVDHPCSTPQTINVSSDFIRTSMETSAEGKGKTQLEAPIEDRTTSSPTPYTDEHEKKHRSEFDDRWVASDKRFKMKEIVNTRIPGKDNPVEEEYRRFEPSMFTYVDTMNSFEKEKAVDPFGVKLRAMAWLRQAKERLAAGGSDYNPGHSPIIVIEEFCAKEEAWNKENGHEAHDQRREMHKDKISHGSLETLLEDSDKENVAEEKTKIE